MQRLSQPPSDLRARRGPGGGFTLVEALVAISLAAFAGSVLLLGIQGSVKTADDARNSAIAQGLAQQLLDEIAGNPYVESGGNAYASPIGPAASQKKGVSRQLFNDIGDYNGYTSQPPVDFWGQPIGSEDGQGSLRNANFQAPAILLANWQQQVTVSYVSETNPTQPLPAGQTSDYRLVQVRILYNDPLTGSQRELVKLQRVVNYVPALQ